MTSVFLLVFTKDEDSIDGELKEGTGDTRRAVEIAVAVVADDSVVISRCDPHFTLTFPLIPPKIPGTGEHFMFLPLKQFICKVVQLANTIR